MKKIALIIMISISIPSCSSAQTISQKDIEKRKIKLDKRKEQKLSELKTRVYEYLQLNNSDKKSTGMSFLERWNSPYRHYPYLKEYSDTLAPELFKYYKYNSSTRKGLGLLKLSQHMKDSIILYKGTEDYVKASMGDSIAERTIIFNFIKVNDRKINSKEQMDSLRKLTFDLLYINNKNTIRAFLKGLESDKVDGDPASSYTEDFKLHESRFAFLLRLYSYVHRYDYIVSTWYNDRFDGLKTINKEMKNYFEEIESHFYNKYNVQIKINAPCIQYGQEEYIEDQIIEDPD